MKVHDPTTIVDVDQIFSYLGLPIPHVPIVDETLVESGKQVQTKVNGLTQANDGAG